MSKENGSFWSRKVTRRRLIGVGAMGTIGVAVSTKYGYDQWSKSDKEKGLSYKAQSDLTTALKERGQEGIFPSSSEGLRANEKVLYNAAIKYHNASEKDDEIGLLKMSPVAFTAIFGFSFLTYGKDIWLEWVKKRIGHKTPTITSQ